MQWYVPVLDDFVTFNCTVWKVAIILHLSTSITKILVAFRRMPENPNLTFGIT